MKQMNLEDNKFWGRAYLPAQKTIETPGSYQPMVLLKYVQIKLVSSTLLNALAIQLIIKINKMINYVFDNASQFIHVEVKTKRHEKDITRMTSRNQ